MNRIKLIIYCHGFKLGFVFILAPILWDLLWSGAREWNLISIGLIGVIIQLAGVFLIWGGGRDSK